MNEQAAQTIPGEPIYFGLLYFPEDGTKPRRVIINETGKPCRWWSAQHSSPQQIAARQPPGLYRAIFAEPGTKKNAKIDPTPIVVRGDVEPVTDAVIPPAPPLSAGELGAERAAVAAEQARAHPEPVGPTPRNPTPESDPLHTFTRLRQASSADSNVITQAVTTMALAMVQGQREFMAMLETARSAERDRYDHATATQAQQYQAGLTANAQSMTGMHEALGGMQTQLGDAATSLREKEIELATSHLENEIERLKESGDADEKTFGDRFGAILEDAGPDFMRDIAAPAGKVLEAWARRMNKDLPAIPGAPVHDVAAE